MDLIEQIKAIDKHKEKYSLDDTNVKNAIYIANMLNNLGDGFEVFVFDGGFQFEWEDDTWYINIELDYDNEIILYVGLLEDCKRGKGNVKKMLFDNLVDWLCQFGVDNNIIY